VIGITGTRGKSTTSALIHQISKYAYGKKRKVYLTGNIAQDGLLYVLDKAKRSDLVIAEFSSYHLELFNTLKKSPHIAIITAIYRDHLHRYSSFQSYVTSKKNMVMHQRKTDYVVLNYDNQISKGFQKYTRAKKNYYSMTRSIEGTFLRENVVYYRGDKIVDRLFLLSELGSLRSIITENILAAVTVSKILGISNIKIRDAIRSYKGLPYRLQFISKINSTTIVNDSCSTTPDATIKAITKMTSPITLIAGGVDKNLKYDSLAKKIKQKVNYTILLPGTATDKIKAALQRIGYHRFTITPKLTGAVKYALKTSKEKKVVLFSPAASSFNLFANEFDRGKQFTNLINHAKKTKV